MPVQSIVPFGMVLRNLAGCQHVRSSNSFATGLGNLTSCQHSGGGGRRSADEERSCLL